MPIISAIIRNIMQIPYFSCLSDESIVNFWNRVSPRIIFAIAFILTGKYYSNRYQSWNYGSTLFLINYLLLSISLACVTALTANIFIIILAMIITIFATNILLNI